MPLDFGGVNAHQVFITNGSVSSLQYDNANEFKTPWFSHSNSVEDSSLPSNVLPHDVRRLDVRNEVSRAVVDDGRRHLGDRRRRLDAGGETLQLLMALHPQRFHGVGVRDTHGPHTLDLLGDPVALRAAKALEDRQEPLTAALPNLGTIVVEVLFPQRRPTFCKTSVGLEMLAQKKHNPRFAPWRVLSRCVRVQTDQTPHEDMKWRAWIARARCSGK